MTLVNVCLFVYIYLLLFLEYEEIRKGVVVELKERVDGDGKMFSNYCTIMIIGDIK